MKLPNWAKDLIEYFRKTPTIKFRVPKGKVGDVRYYKVVADIQDYSMDWDFRKDAEAYKKPLTKSRNPTKSKIVRMEIDGETGLHVTYPPEEKK